MPPPKDLLKRPTRTDVLAFALLLAFGAPTAPGFSQGNATVASPPLAVAPDRIRPLLDIAASIVSRSNELAAIWPGYWPQNQAFILYDPEIGALLVSPGERPDSYAPLADMAVPPVLRGRVFFHSGRLPDVNRPFIIGHPIGNDRTAVVVDVRRAADTADTADTAEVFTLLFHEQFHFFQQSVFTGRTPQFVDPLAIRDRVAFAAAAQVERRVLAAALSAPEAPERTRRLRQYFALRRAREATMPEAVVRVERGFERIEGLARYVDRRARVILSDGESGIASLLRAELESTPDPDSTSFMTVWFRSRSYGNGAALGHLLDLYDPAGWQRAVERDGQLDLLLENHVGRGGDAARLAAEARTEFGHDSLVAELAPRIRAAERAEIKSVPEFLALAPLRLVVEIEETDGDARAQVGFFAMQMIALGPSTMALPMARQFGRNEQGLELSVQGRPVLMESRGGTETITVLLTALPRINDAEAQAGEQRLERGAIRGEGIELRLGRPALITVEATRIRVRIPALPAVVGRNPSPS